MLKIGLTGGIGSGKTIVAGIFQLLGIPVFDADAIAKNIMVSDPELIAAIQDAFGTEAYSEGQLNRGYLSAIVFNDPDKLKKLNALVHPVTIAAAGNWMEKQTAPYVVKEAALLFEAGSAAHLDYVVGVHAPVMLRLQRTMQRDNANSDSVLARMSRQMDDDIKMKLCDFVIVNDDMQLLIPQVLQLHEKLIQISSDTGVSK